MKTAIQILSDLAFQHKKQVRSSVPEHMLVRTKYSDKDANGLTRCIMDFLRLQGAYAVRVNTQGQYNERLGQWTKSTTTKGTSDLISCFKGRLLAVEVKIGRDKQSPEQLQVEQQVNQAGGLYFVARDFQSFYEWFESQKAGC